MYLKSSHTISVTSMNLKPEQGAIEEEHQVNYNRITQR